MEYIDNNYLAHYGVKGMKWGVVKSVASGVGKAYKGLDRHGSKVLERSAQRSDYRSQYHASRGNKIRAKYYDKKAFKTRDKTFDETESVLAGIKDLSIKSQRIAAVASVGAVAVKGIIRYKQSNKYIRF